MNYKEFVKHEQALALKELGFDEHCLACYDEYEDLIIISNDCNLSQNSTMYEDNCSAPLKQQVFRWFREKHEFNYHIKQEDRNNYSYYCGIDYSDSIRGWGDFATYKEAEDACIDKLIEIIKNK